MKNPIDNKVFSKSDLEQYKDYVEDELLSEMNDFYEDKVEDFEDLEYFEEVEEFINTLDEPLCHEFTDKIDELEELIDFCETLEGYNGDTIIDEDEIDDYLQQFVEDCGDLPSDLPNYIHIDWDSTIQDLLMDYSSFEYDNTTYYALS